MNDLEAIADEACRSVRLLAGLNRNVDLEAYSVFRQKCRSLAAGIEMGLAHTAMASLKKEDLVAVATALARIPEAVERFAERYILAQGKVSDLDYTALIEQLGLSGDAVVSMVRQLRIFDNEPKTRQLNVHLQETVDATERLAEEMIELLLQGERDPLKLIVGRDLADHAMAIANVCGACGELIVRVILKYV